MEKVRIKKTYESDRRVLPELERFFMNVLKDLNLPEQKYNSLILALSEASSNAIKHGNKNDSNKKVNIEIIIDEKKIEILIKDEGSGFDPSVIPDPTEPENLLKESGRGLYIIKSFVDDFFYEFLPDGTVAHLIVYR